MASRRGLFSTAGILLYIAPFLWIRESSGSISFASYYNDHMVLQRAPKSNIIWGYATTVGAMVSVTLSGKPPVTTHVVEGPMTGKATWKVQLPPVSDPGPYEISVESDDGNTKIVDVLFGDVWLCSGQSNMQFTLPQVLNADQELVDSYNYPDIRVFTVDLKTSDQEEYDLLSVLEHWSVPSNATVGYAPWQYFSAVCWLYGKYLYQHLKYPIGLISSTWGGTPIEAWSSKDVMAQCGGDGIQHKVGGIQDPALPKMDVDVSTNELWNAMIHPLLNLTIYGAIWYQGEANAGEPDKYKCYFPAMIDDWRSKFHDGSMSQTDPQFPFGFVQLAPWRNDPTITTGFPDLRWAQTADFGYVPNAQMPNVFMAVAIDLPDFDSPYGGIHPRDKQDVANRLVLSSLPIAYNMSAGKYQGPFPTAFYIDIGYDTLGIEYDTGSSLLDVRSMDGFEVCCSKNNQSLCNPDDSKWNSVPIVKHDDHIVTMSYKNQCPSMYIVGLRYAWRESPCDFKNCAVYSKENSLPAPPYIMIGLIG